MKHLESCNRLDKVKVRGSSTIRVNHNTYSVNSRLVDEHVNIRLYVEHLEVWYGQKKVETIPRLLGENKHCINYRHVIDSLVRKPGAFANYKWREDMFPTIRFRMAYDSLMKAHAASVAAKTYLKILQLAARKSESAVDMALRILIDQDIKIEFETVEKYFKSEMTMPSVKNVSIPRPNLIQYDVLCMFQMAGV
ncbi:MAG: hypothetical protein U9P42_04085 [Candidatus Fermentibacteria bacterium]|nr:hypothetical protein [Candidatus Fermentibacteria bacterium]